MRNNNNNYYLYIIYDMKLQELLQGANAQTDHKKYSGIGFLNGSPRTSYKGDRTKLRSAHTQENQRYFVGHTCYQCSENESKTDKDTDTPYTGFRMRRSFDCAIASFVQVANEGIAVAY